MHTFSQDAIKFLQNKLYLKGEETLEERVKAICNKIEKYEYPYIGLAKRLEKAILTQKLVPSTPIFSNVGRAVKKNKSVALPCSCNIITVPDSIAGIYFSIGETAMLSKLGAGVGHQWEGLSQKGTLLDEGFYSNSKLDWIEDAVRASSKVSQGTNRRGYSVPYIGLMDNDFYEMMERIDKRNPSDTDPLIKNNIGIILPHDFDNLVQTDDEVKKRYIEVLKNKKETGRVYLLHKDNANKNHSPVYEKLGHIVDSSNICTEPCTPSYEDKTFCCMLWALNLSKWDEITPQDIKDAFIGLDIINSIYVEQTEGVPFLEKARRSAIEKRDIGLSTLGFHDYVQSKGFALGDIGCRKINKDIFKEIRELGEEATKEMAEKWGTPKMCEEAGLVRRNVSLMMIAPHKSSSAFSNNTSMGIEPYSANYYLRELAGISVIIKNKHLEKRLIKLNKDTTEVWNSILENLGSAQHLDFLTDIEKDVFKTANEVSPKDLIDLASDRQEFIDMSQSFNLFNRPNYTLQDVYEIHKYAWSKGIKTLYYFYSQGHAAIEKNGEKWDDCISCAD